MSISPIRDKNKVVRELSTVVRDAKREHSHSSKKKRLRNINTGSSNKTTSIQRTDRSKKFHPSIEHPPMNKSIVQPQREIPTLNLQKTMNAESSITSGRRKSYREQLWEDSSQIERLVQKIQKRSGLPPRITEQRESREIYDNVMDETASDLMTVRQSYEKGQIPQMDMSRVKVKLSLKKKKLNV